MALGLIVTDRLNKSEIIELFNFCLFAYLGVFIHSLLHVLQQVVVGSPLPLVDVDDAVQVGEVTVQIHPLCVTAAHKPVLDLSGLSRKKGEDVQTHVGVQGSVSGALIITILAVYV